MLLQKGIREIVTVARKVATGNFTNKARVFSKDEIGFLADSFNQMVGNLEKKTLEEKRAENALHNQKELFMANMSHEIRTPVTGIMGLTELLDETNLTTVQQEYLDGIKNSSESLLAIINEILDISKINAGKITFEKKVFDFRSIIKNIAFTLIPKANQKDVSFSYSIDDVIPKEIIGDQVRLSQILWNIAGNAIKFTEKGSVQLKISLQNEDDTSVRLLFSVADTGIGIPDNRLEGIFEAFTQADPNTSRKYEGTGLGLTIASKLIELQGGSISVESIVDKGSTFRFSIPYNKYFPRKKPEEIDAGQLPSLNIFNLENIHVLLAEDNKVNQKVCSKILTSKGVRVDIAENGKIAVYLASSKQYDIILMDIQMPEMDGYEATRFIRTTMPKPICDTPIIALTAFAMEGEDEKCKAAGMNGFVSKPFKANELCAKIMQFTGQKNPIL